jgi:hypothetical protein
MSTALDDLMNQLYLISLTPINLISKLYHINWNRNKPAISQTITRDELKCIAPQDKAISNSRAGVQGSPQEQSPAKV